jgi:hypothetical protein
MQCFPGFSKCSEMFVMQAVRLSQVLLKIHMPNASVIAGEISLA